MVVRIILTITISVIALIFPWWVALLFATILIFCRETYEMLIVGIILDSIYNKATSNLWISYFFFTALIFLIIGLANIIRPRIQGITRKVTTY